MSLKVINESYRSLRSKLVAHINKYISSNRGNATIGVFDYSTFRGNATIGVRGFLWQRYYRGTRLFVATLLSERQMVAMQPK